MGKRLLLLVTDLLVGGTPAVVRELATRLHRQGVDVRVACLGEWGPTADEIRAAGVPVTALGAKGMLDWAVFRKVSRLIGDEKVDVVLSFLVHANVAGSLAKIGGRFELYESIQTTQSRPRWHWWAQWLAGRSARRIIVPSESVAETARKRSWIAAEKITVIPNAVDVPPAMERRAEDGRVNVVFVGRLDPIKRIPDLLEAISLMGNEYRLAIYGTGREEAELRRHIARMKLDSRATLKGVAEGPWAALAESDVLVLPSEAEGFGLVLIEAMAAGVPVVATDAPGIRDVVRDGENGLLVPVGNPTALALAIRRAARDMELQKRLVACGRRTVAERFSWGPVLESYRNVLRV